MDSFLDSRRATIEARGMSKLSQKTNGGLLIAR
jgi:hypothetical protein